MSLQAAVISAHGPAGLASRTSGFAAGSAKPAAAARAARLARASFVTEAKVSQGMPPRLDSARPSVDLTPTS